MSLKVSGQIKNPDDILRVIPENGNGVDDESLFRAFLFETEKAVSHILIRKISKFEAGIFCSAREKKRKLSLASSLGRNYNSPNCNHCEIFSLPFVLNVLQARLISFEE